METERDEASIYCGASLLSESTGAASAGGR